MARKSAGVRLGIGVLAGLLLVGTSGCSLISRDLPAPDRNQAGEIVAEADTNVLSLEVGDCTSTQAPPDQAEAAAAGERIGVSEVTAVPCQDGHVFEAYAGSTLPDGDFPGDASVADAADAFCATEFEVFVGLSYDESELYFTALSPTEEGWSSMGDRQILCMVHTEDEAPVAGSLAGAAR